MDPNPYQSPREEGGGPPDEATSLWSEAPTWQQWAIYGVVMTIFSAVLVLVLAAA